MIAEIQELTCYVRSSSVGIASWIKVPQKEVQLN